MTETRFIDRASSTRRGHAFTMTVIPRRPLALAILTLCLVAGARPASAATNLPPAPAVAAPAAMAPGEERKRVTVNPGESVMALIRRTLPNSPYRDDFLRKALHRMNPDAFVSGSLFRLKNAAVVVVPSAADLQRMAWGEGAAPAAVIPPPPPPPQTRPELERKAWVRYP
jgi:Tfp pilus assembly protein FimV